MVRLTPKIMLAFKKLASTTSPELHVESKQSPIYRVFFWMLMGPSTSVSRAYDLAFLGGFCNKRALAITMLHSFTKIMGGFPTDILSPFQPICPPGDTRSCVTCPDVQDWPGLEQEMLSLIHI